LKIGIIAGSGKLPVILAQEIQNAGKQAIIISVSKDADESLKSLTPDFHQLGVGQVKKIINTFLDFNVKELAIIGKVSKDTLFNPLHFDTKAIKIVSKLKDKSDSSLFSAIADEIESSGIKIIDQRQYLGKLLPEKDVLTKNKPSKSQLHDIEYGMELAKKVSELGIGQTVVVKDQIILAVEAIEGTDEAIRRGAKLCKGGAVIAKASKSDQDFRFDVPTIGPNTIDVLMESKASVLAIEYGKAFLLEREFTIHKADEAKISLIVI
jgi:DUF1009 family protein